jgi:hypothetical protein
VSVEDEIRAVIRQGRIQNAIATKRHRGNRKHGFRELPPPTGAPRRNKRSQFAARPDPPLGTSASAGGRERSSLPVSDGDGGARPSPTLADDHHNEGRE